MSIPFGPFTGHTLIGRGGMGEVWAGTHTAQGVPVAIKLLHGAVTRRAVFVEAFNREVRAVARLTGSSCRSSTMECSARQQLKAVT